MYIARKSPKEMAHEVELYSTIYTWSGRLSVATFFCEKVYVEIIYISKLLVVKSALCKLLEITGNHVYDYR